MKLDTVTKDGYLTVVPNHVTTRSTTVNGNVLCVTDERQVVLHEFGHRVEHGNPYITSLERSSIRARIDENETPEITEDYIRYEDMFANRYSGTVWRDELRKTELFTTGLETLCGYRNGAGIGVAIWSDFKDKTVSGGDLRLIEDRELLTMTLGILITAKREK